MTNTRTAFTSALAGATLALAALSAPAAAERFDVSGEDVAQSASALEVLHFVLDNRIGIEDSLVAITPYDIPGNLYVRMPGDDRWNPYTILTEEQRANTVSINMLDPTQGNFVDLVFSEGTEVNGESPIGILSGLLGIGFSEHFRTHFKFEPVLTARGPSYGPGNPELMAQINRFATLFQQAGFETYYVNSVDVYRSFNERYVQSGRQLNAGFALVSGGRVYTRENSQTRQRVHYVLNAAKIIPGLSEPNPTVGGAADVGEVVADSPAPSSPFGDSTTRSISDGPMSDETLKARFDAAADFVTRNTGVARDASLETEINEALSGEN